MIFNIFYLFIKYSSQRALEPYGNYNDKSSFFFFDVLLIQGFRGGCRVLGRGEVILKGHAPPAFVLFKSQNTAGADTGFSKGGV